MLKIDTFLNFLSINHIQYSFKGDREKRIEGFSSVTDCKENTITWIKNIDKYRKIKIDWQKVQPGLIVINEDIDKVTDYTNKLICENPKYVFYLILQEFFMENEDARVADRIGVSLKALIGRNVAIGYHCVIEDDVIIGDNTRIYNNVVIRKGTMIGKNCIIKSGTVIGEEGYGYSHNGNKWFRVPHFGHVIIEDDVEIGANCSIDRGTLDNTVIGRGSKIDNLCHIAHNVVIGTDVAVVAGVIIGGSAYIDDEAYIAPGAIIRNQIEVEKECVIGMGSVVLKDAQKGKVIAGVPARVLRDVVEENL